jgi:hypothetical protein
MIANVWYSQDLHPLSGQVKRQSQRLLSGELIEVAR